MRRRYLEDKGGVLYENYNINFNGDSYIDTYIKLWDLNKFTIILSYTSNYKGVLGTILHSMEEYNPYRGIAIDDPYGSNEYGRLAATTSLTNINNYPFIGNKKTLILLRNDNKFMLYTNDKYKSGINVSNMITIIPPSSNINLILGAYYTGYTYGRYWNGVINSIEILDYDIDNNLINEILK